MTFAGGCLCGAVRYQCAAEPAMAGFCQCEDCRRSSGAGHCAHLGVPEAAVALTGETAAYARPADSGNVITRHFCPTCGAALFSTNSGMPGLMFLRASSLDDQEVFKPQMVVYASRGASWDRFDEKLPRFQTMPPGM
jgi:hypothetical protein